MKIIGIDPGTAITGYSVIEKEGNRLTVITYGCIYTESNTILSERLHKIFLELTEIITQYQPTHMAVEELFFNTNAKTALSVGHARGVILLAGELHSLIVAGYTPLQVKQAIAGYGRAEKSQVQKMVKTILCLDKIPKPDDAADALAVAICHSQSFSMNHKLRGIR